MSLYSVIQTSFILQVTLCGPVLSCCVGLCRGRLLLECSSTCRLPGNCARGIEDPSIKTQPEVLEGEWVMAGPLCAPPTTVERVDVFTVMESAETISNCVVIWTESE